MSKILIFDLDDTLYDERIYVESGLRAVAAFGKQRFGWDAAQSFDFMVEVLDWEGRGAIFNRWLARHGQESRALVTHCVKLYRHHEPTLWLNEHAERLLPRWASLRPLYLITDGHKIVQQRKVEALGIAPYFRRVFITHRYGIRHAKPSLHCFDLIRRREACDWSQLIYVGDNPAKDFVGLNRMGGHTIRVLTGVHRHMQAAPGYDAQHSIPDLGHLPKLLEELDAELPAGS